MIEVEKCFLSSFYFYFSHFSGHHSYFKKDLQMQLADNILRLITVSVPCTSSPIYQKSLQLIETLFILSILSIHCLKRVKYLARWPVYHIALYNIKQNDTYKNMVTNTQQYTYTYICTNMNGISKSK